MRLIGRGGMGAVYEVEHARTGEHLALKVLLSGLGPSPETVERFKREARASALIKSEYVVRVTDADVAPELEGAPFLVMELLEGVNFEQAAAASPPGPESVLAWLRQVAQAIDKAHRLGIIHRDLKPENLFLVAGESQRPIVKVLDFGIAKMLEEGTGVTGAGQMLGTPKYMSPEQATPNAAVTPATDRCALGLIAYRLLVGESYYQGGAMSILGQILHGELKAPSACGSCLGGAFDAWFLKACHREPGRRFASASEQVEALAQALGLSRAGNDVTLPGAAVRTPAEAPQSSRSRPRPVAVASFVAAGLAAVSLTALLVYRAGHAGRSGATPAATSPAPSAAQPPPGPLPVPAAGEPAPLRPATTEAAAPDVPVIRAIPGHGADQPAVARRQVLSGKRVKESLTPAKASPAIDPYAEQK